MNDNSRKTDTESTQYITHSDVGADTITACHSGVLQESPTDPDDCFPISRETAHHLVKNHQSDQELYRQSSELPKQEPYAYYGCNCYHCRYSRPAVTPYLIVKRTPIKQIWNYLKIFLRRLL